MLAVTMVLGAAVLSIHGLLAVALCYGLVRSRPQRGVHDPPNLLAAAIWIAAVGFLVQMMFNVAMLASTVPFWVLFGTISASRAQRVAVGSCSCAWP